VSIPHRTLSLTSIMSSTGNPGVPPATPEAMAVLTRRAPHSSSPDTWLPGVDCYAAIISVWAPGDRIYLFGFSRGARPELYWIWSLSAEISERAPEGCGILQRRCQSASRPDYSIARLLQNLGQHHHDADISFQNVRGNNRNVKGVLVLHLRRSLVILGENKENISIHLSELHTQEKTVELFGADDERHARCDCMFLHEW
jgi:type VI secretion system (T6SS) phospholipase Tle1-like effector